MTSNANKTELDRKDMAPILWFEDLRREDFGKVGGKNSSLGEMVSTLGAMGVQVPPVSTRLRQSTGSSSKPKISAAQSGSIVASASRASSSATTSHPSCTVSHKP
jgi:hypothetical protein